MKILNFTETERNRRADLIIDQDGIPYAVRIARPPRCTFDRTLDVFPLPHDLAATDPRLYQQLRDAAAAEWLKRDRRRRERRFWTPNRLRRFAKKTGGLC